MTIYHNSGRKYEHQTNDHIFFICFLSPNCFGDSFFQLKIVKIHFHRSLLWPIVVWKIMTFGGDTCEIQIFSCSIQKIYTLRKKNKPGFTFSIELRTNSKIFRVISWSIDVDKTEKIIFRPKSKDITKKLNFRISSQQMYISEQMKYLGVMLD